MTRSGWIATFGTTGFAIMLALGSSILLARGLGPEGRGLLMTLTVWPAILAGMFSLSINESTSYHVARASTVGADPNGIGSAAAGFIIQCTIALAATLLAISVLMVVEHNSPYLPLVLAYAATFTPVMIMDLHFKAVLQGRGTYRRLSATRLTQPLTYLLCVVALTVGKELTVETVMIAIVFTLAVSLLTGAGCAGIGRLSGVKFAMMREIVATGWKFHITNLLLASGAWIERIFVVRWYDETDVGYYAVAVAMGSLGTGLLVPSLAITATRRMPAATSDHAKAQILQHHYTIALLAVLIVNGPFALLAAWWVPLIFGEAFAPAAPTIMIFLFTGTLLTLRQVIDRAMRAAHVARIGMIGEAVALATLVPCSLAGSLLFGFNGFALGLAAVQLCALVVVNIIAVRTLGVHPRDLIPNPLSLMRLAESLGLRGLRG